MNGNIEIKTRKIPSGYYRSRVLVNGHFYASVESANRDEAIREAQHYASQIEFDEFGNW